ncbi:MAG: hypothetical protein U9N34_08535, partial [Candidatus Cloacimonadota bacterium]|nr:hypothetical protein [Candidatus Cloacimonadota bacterium]
NIKDSEYETVVGSDKETRELYMYKAYQMNEDVGNYTKLTDFDSFNNYSIESGVYAGNNSRHKDTIVKVGDKQYSFYKTDIEDNHEIYQDAVYLEYGNKATIIPDKSFSSKGKDFYKIIDEDGNTYSTILSTKDDLHQLAIKHIKTMKETAKDNFDVTDLYIERWN